MLPCWAKLSINRHTAARMKICLTQTPENLCWIQMYCLLLMKWCLLLISNSVVILVTGNIEFWTYIWTYHAFDLSLSVVYLDKLNSAVQQNPSFKMVRLRGHDSCLSCQRYCPHLTGNDQTPGTRQWKLGLVYGNWKHLQYRSDGRTTFLLSSFLKRTNLCKYTGI